MGNNLYMLFYMSPVAEIVMEETLPNSYTLLFFHCRLILSCPSWFPKCWLVFYSIFLAFNFSCHLFSAIFMVSLLQYLTFFEFKVSLFSRIDAYLDCCLTFADDKRKRSWTNVSCCFISELHILVLLCWLMLIMMFDCWFWFDLSQIYSYFHRSAAFWNNFLSFNLL